MYCSYAQKHPVETATFIIGGIVTAAAIPEAGAVADGIDTLGWKLLGGCLKNSICRIAFGLDVPGVLPKKITGNTFVRYDPISSDKSINNQGLLTSYSGGKIWVTQYKYVSDITHSQALETILYKQSLWPEMAGKFTSGATLRAININGAVPAGISNMVNGIPQWYITTNIPPDLIQIIGRIEP